jgi:serine O-acetyltransferase
MKTFLKPLLLSLKIILISPLLIALYLTSAQELILADVRRWEELLGREKGGELTQLAKLLWETPEFRNLYYHRLFRGNLAGRLAMYILKIVYHPFPYLWLDGSCNIGAGLFIQHGFSTIVMADIGENCWINQQVTIGYKDKSGRPQLGNNVRVTAGAKVIGNIKVGDNVTVGANAVVVKDVPNNCVVVGVPAYIINRDGVKVKEEL